MALFGRKAVPAVSDVVVTTVALGVLPCSQPGCGETTGLACAYVDRRGRLCTTAWCPDHRVEVEGNVYCRRHAGVTRALVGSDTPSAPDISSRAASLAAWIAADVGPRIIPLLQNVAQPGEQLRSQPPRLVFVGRTRVRVWEHAWKLTRHTGLGHWVSIQVPEDHDDQVHVVVDGLEVHEGVPPWIAARRDGRPLSDEQDAGAREGYYAAIVEAVAEGLKLDPPQH